MDTLRDDSSALLEEQSSRVFTHDIGQASQQSVARSNISVEGSIDVVKEVQRLRDQLEALLEETGRDAGLTGVEVGVGVRGVGVEVFHQWVEGGHVIDCEDRFGVVTSAVGGHEGVLAKGELDTH